MKIFQIIKWLLQASLVMLVLFVLPTFAKPIFQITTSNQSTTVSPGGTAMIAYIVKNVSGINMSKMRFIPPTTTTISNNMCGSTLANQASCTVMLTIHAPSHQGRYTLGSLGVCGNGKGSFSSCSQPDASNLVQVIVTPVTSTFTLTPSAGANGSISPSTPQTVNVGNSFVFTALPNTGYEVDQWSVDGSLAQTGGNTYTFTNVNANHTILVTFKILTFTVTPSAGANGSISPNTPQTVNYGDSVMFTATPNTGFMVSQWLVDGSLAQTGGTTFTLSNVTANHTVEVTFTIMTFTVTPSTGGNGSISPNTPQTVNYGDSVMFTATPNTGYLVNQWLVDGTVMQTGGTSFTLTNVTADHTVEVTFVIMTFTVTPSAGSNGSISPNTPQTIDYGSNAMFTATPNANYEVNQWLVDGSLAQTGGTTFTLTNVTADHTVQVTFIHNPLLYVVNGTGTVFYCTLNSDGTINTCNTAATGFTNAQGVAVNTAGTFGYVADENTGAVSYCPINVDGTFGSCTTTGNGFTEPRQVIVNPADTVAYVADLGNNAVYFCPVNGNGSLGTCNTTGSGISTPAGMATNPADSIFYVASSGNTVVFCTISNIDGSLSGCGTTGSFNDPFGVAINPADTIAYVINALDHIVDYCVINGDGSLSSCTNAGGGTFNIPAYIVLNTAGTMAYVSDSSGGTVYACPINGNGSFGTCVGKSFSGNPAGLAYLP